MKIDAAIWAYLFHLAIFIDLFPSILNDNLVNMKMLHIKFPEIASKDFQLVIQIFSKICCAK